MYEAVLLDVYGTLVHDDDSLVAGVAAEVAARGGVAAEIVAREWAARLDALAEDAHGATFRLLADLTLDSLAGAAAEVGVGAGEAREIYERRAAQRGVPPLFPDARGFLAALDVPVCLVSDADRDDLHAVLAHHGITTDFVVTSEDARAYKPRPEPFQLALRHLAREAGDVVHVGDSPAYDLAGARRLGIDAVLVDRGGAATTRGLAGLPTRLRGGRSPARRDPRRGS